MPDVVIGARGLVIQEYTEQSILVCEKRSVYDISVCIENVVVHWR